MRSVPIELDEVDVGILDILQANARTTMRELGARVGLSGPAVAERVRRLEERGALRGYRAEVVPGRIGLGVVAWVSLGASPDTRSSGKFEREVQDLPEVAECYRITGEDAYLLKVAVADMDTLRETLDRLGEYGRLKTSVVIAVPKWPAPLHPYRGRPAGPPFRHGAD